MGLGWGCYAGLTFPYQMYGHLKKGSHFNVTYGTFGESYQIHSRWSPNNKAEKKLGNDNLKYHGLVSVT